MNWPNRESNCPMLAMENSLIDELTVDHDNADYLHSNQRVLNKVSAIDLGLNYYILQFADYDVDSITPFDISLIGLTNKMKDFLKFVMALK